MSSPPRARSAMRNRRIARAGGDVVVDTEEVAADGRRRSVEGLQRAAAGVWAYRALPSRSAAATSARRGRGRRRARRARRARSRRASDGSSSALPHVTRASRSSFTASAAASASARPPSAQGIHRARRGLTTPGAAARRRSAWPGRAAAGRTARPPDGVQADDPEGDPVAAIGEQRQRDAPEVVGVVVEIGDEDHAGLVPPRVERELSRELEPGGDPRAGAERLRPRVHRKRREEPGRRLLRQRKQRTRGFSSAARVPGGSAS